MKKIKVVEVVGRMDMAGQETFLMNVLRSADLDKYEIWFSVNTNYIGDYEKEILALGGHIFHNPYPANRQYMIQNIREFRRFLHQEGPFDVVHSHVYYYSAFILKAAYSEYIPVRIMHSHSTSDGYNRTLFRLIYRRLSLYLINRYSTYEVACGIDAYEAFYKRKCPGPEKIIDNAVNIDLYNEASIDINQLKTSYGLLSNEVVISVARFLPVKNHKFIIDVFEDLKKERPNAVLLLVGDGPQMKEIKSYTERKGISDQVFFLGKRNDVNKLLLCSDVFLMPSLHEGLPVSLVEAQAAGVSCVLSDTITTEIDMGLGLIHWCSLSDPIEKWTQAICAASNDSRVEFAKRKEKLDEHGFTLKNTWNKLERLYEKGRL